MYINGPFWSRLRVRILLYCAHANEVRMAFSLHCICLFVLWEALCSQNTLVYTHHFKQDSM